MAQRLPPAFLPAPEKDQAGDVGPNLVAESIEIRYVEAADAIDVNSGDSADAIDNPRHRHPEQLAPPVRLRHRAGGLAEALSEGIEPLENAFAFPGERPPQPLPQAAPLEAKLVENEAGQQPAGKAGEGKSDKLG